MASSLQLGEALCQYRGV